MAWNPDDPIERRKRICWAVATSSCIETGQDPVLVYEKLMRQAAEVDLHGHMALHESPETKQIT